MAGVNTVPLLELRDVSRIRAEAGGCARVAGVSLRVGRGEVLALTGDTGCGKNLILRLLSLLEVPDSGDVLFDGEPTGQLTDDARIEFRSRRCGYLFTSPFLLAAFNVAENIAMPIFKISQLTPEQARDRTEGLLRFVGLDAAAGHRTLPPRLQQRVALARALANAPSALFVENLETLVDPEDLLDFRSLLHAAAREFGVAVVVTAPRSLAPMPGERRREVADGRLGPEGPGDPEDSEIAADG
jgi:lipoprotein-releasing system ATP-binding protein